MNISDEIARSRMEHFAKITEDMCQQAVEKGPGWRVWCGDPKLAEPSSENCYMYSIVHEFQMLPPGASPPPGSGTIYGPWDATAAAAPDRERAAHAQAAAL